MNSQHNTPAMGDIKRAACDERRSFAFKTSSPVDSAIGSVGGSTIDSADSGAIGSADSSAFGRAGGGAIDSAGGSATAGAIDCARAARRAVLAIGVAIGSMAFSATAFAQTPPGPPGPPLSPALQAQLAKDFTRLQEIEGRAARVDDVNELRTCRESSATTSTRRCGMTSPISSPTRARWSWV
ncbi:MAG: hypothetical protein WDO68_25345 [Gammaproteobacteria bacterium]